MNKAEFILNKIRKETSEIILFSSLTGKDSILLTHYCCQIFEHVVSVYMYIIEDLEYVNHYENYFKARYKNIEYLHIPHWTLTRHIRTGFLGIKRDGRIKILNLEDMVKQVRVKTKIAWVCFGMKKFDSIQRMFDLREMEDDAISRIAKRVYPLSELNNKQVLELIKKNKLPMPVRYNKDHSQCQEVNNIDYIGWLYENYPRDLKKTIDQYPRCNTLLYEYTERKKDKTGRDNNYKEITDTICLLQPKKTHERFNTKTIKEL